MSRLLPTVAVVLVSVLGVLPVVLLLLGALQPVGQPIPGLGLSLVSLQLGNFGSALAVLDEPWRMLANSMIVAAVAVPVTIVVASTAGLAVVLARGRSRSVLLGAVVAPLFVPAVALWVPRVVLLRGVGLTDSLVGLMTPALLATTPFYALLFALTFATRPRAVLDAARLAGLGPTRLWWRVALPQARATTFAVAVLSFAVHWSNHVDALLLLSSPEQSTVPLGVAQLTSLEASKQPVMLAGALLASVPPLLAFVVGHRAFLVRSLER